MRQDAPLTTTPAQPDLPDDYRRDYPATRDDADEYFERSACAPDQRSYRTLADVLEDVFTGRPLV